MPVVNGFAPLRQANFAQVNLVDRHPAGRGVLPVDIHGVHGIVRGHFQEAIFAVPAGLGVPIPADEASAADDPEAALHIALHMDVIEFVVAGVELHGVVIAGNLPAGEGAFRTGTAIPGIGNAVGSRLFAAKNPGKLNLVLKDGVAAVGHHNAVGFLADHIVQGNLVVHRGIVCRLNGQSNAVRINAPNPHPVPPALHRHRRVRPLVADGVDVYIHIPPRNAGRFAGLIPLEAPHRQIPFCRRLKAGVEGGGIVRGIISLCTEHLRGQIAQRVKRQGVFASAIPVNIILDGNPVGKAADRHREEGHRRRIPGHIFGSGLDGSGGIIQHGAHVGIVGFPAGGLHVPPDAEGSGISRDGHPGGNIRAVLAAKKVLERNLLARTVIKQQRHIDAVFHRCPFQKRPQNNRVSGLQRPGQGQTGRAVLVHRKGCPRRGRAIDVHHPPVFTQGNAVVGETAVEAHFQWKTVLPQQCIFGKSAHGRFPAVRKRCRFRGIRHGEVCIVPSPRLRHGNGRCLSGGLTGKLHLFL